MNMSTLLKSLEELRMPHSNDETEDEDVVDGYFECYLTDNRPKYNAKVFKVIPKNDADMLSFIDPNLSDGPWVAGGTALNWYNGAEASSDIDVFFSNREQFDEMNNKINRIRHCSTLFHSKNAITYGIESSSHKTFKVQLICKEFYDSAESVLNNFDMTVCQVLVAFDKDGNLKFKFGDDTRDDIKHKRIRLTYTNDVREHQLKRVIKYMGYGYIPESGLMDRLISARNSIVLDFKYSGVDDYDHM